MEWSPATGAGAGSKYKGWEEVVVSNEKGRRVVHYCLKRNGGGGGDGGGGGGTDLVVVVVGKEKSLRHMVYRFVNQGIGLVDLGIEESCLPKLRSRREVIDWFNSNVPGSSTIVSSQSNDDYTTGKESSQSDQEFLEVAPYQKVHHYPKDFLWLGSSWTCKKKRKHYQSLFHNGVKISVNDFVYVLGEDDKRLVAYLDDMYEDSRGKNMVVVQWFHKVDEVDANLPRNFNDREIFFSLSLQDLSVECIDGLACVLSADHFNKFCHQAKRSCWDPFFCRRKYDNYDFKPFDMTQLKGYWNQEILRCMYVIPLPEETQLLDGQLRLEDPSTCGVVNTSRKRIRLSRGSKRDPQIASVSDSGNVMSADDCPAREEITLERPSSHLAVGGLVEVLSQDSGIRGCWFRASVIKKHKDKVKVRYQDLRDADDETINLEEWVLASRFAAEDYLGLRINGRTTVRPAAVLRDGKVSWVIEVGAVVDAWWCDGWWEGIVIQKESKDKLRVYFPGERKDAVFSHGDLRHSQEWLGGAWNYFKCQPDLASSILSNLGMNSKVGRETQASICKQQQGLGLDVFKVPLWDKDGDCGRMSHVVLGEEKVTVPDLLKDGSLSQLRWCSTRKRKRIDAGVQKSNYDSENIKRTTDKWGSDGDIGNFMVSVAEQKPNPDDKFPSFKVDRENCKYVGDTLFNSPVAPRLTSLVMSR